MRGISWCEIIIGILVIVFALLNRSYSKIALLILGVLLILHAVMCKKCKMCNIEEMPKARGRRK